MLTHPFRRLAPAFVAVALLLAFSSGCAMHRSRINIEKPFARFAKIQPNVTRADELEGILGTAPSNIVPVGADKQGWVYSYGDSKSWTLGIILFNIQKTNTGVDTAVVIVDQAGYVDRVIAGSNSKNVGWSPWPFGG
jgi:hypothetical protein